MNFCWSGKNNIYLIFSNLCLWFFRVWVLWYFLDISLFNNLPWNFLSDNNILILQNNFSEFDFFFKKCFLFISKSSLSRSQKSESEVSKVNPRFKKNSEGPKMDQKSLNYFPGFLPRDSSYCSETSFKWLTQSFSNVHRSFFYKFFNLRILYQKISFFE